MLVLPWDLQNSHLPTMYFLKPVALEHCTYYVMNQETAAATLLAVCYSVELHRRSKITNSSSNVVVLILQVDWLR